MDWEDLLEHAVTSFGSAPNPDLRDRFNNEAQRHPATLKAEVDRIANGYHDGQIRSPWGVLRKKLDELADIAPKIAKGRDQAKAQQRAEQWMRAAGLHYPTWDEAHDDLFGDRGQLAPWPDLTDHLERLYTELRPTGERIEHELEQRAETWKRQRAEAAKHPKPTAAAA